MSKQVDQHIRLMGIQIQNILQILGCIVVVVKGIQFKDRNEFLLVRMSSIKIIEDGIGIVLEIVRDLVIGKKMTDESVVVLLRKRDKYSLAVDDDIKIQHRHIHIGRLELDHLF